MSAICVCPLSRLRETVARFGASHLVTLIDTPVARPPEIAAPHHLFLGMHDICEPAEGMICPAEEHLTQLFDFVTRWDRPAPLVVHCFAGISRSTAAAFSASCALRPELDEEEIAVRLRARSPDASPNARIVAVADAMLSRNGRMVRAIARIGRGADAFEGSVFALSLQE
jgi:predicted protein tyrosine phosphatase